MFSQVLPIHCELKLRVSANPSGKGNSKQPKPELEWNLAKVIQASRVTGTQHELSLGTALLHTHLDLKTDKKALEGHGSDQLSNTGNLSTAAKPKLFCLIIKAKQCKMTEKL